MLHKLTAYEVAEKIKSKEFSAVEVAQNMIGRAENNEINAYITVCGDNAIEKAKRVDEKIAKGESLPPLAGVPYAAKDNLCTKDILTTCASKMLYNFKPPYSAFAVQRLDDNECVLTGKVNMDEFAMGSSNETSYYGAVKNPYNHNCVPGGSSGGSGAAVAAGLAYFALGSDTGGSIRLPASFCGVTGLKPTYGMVSRFGLVAFASSLDQIGPLTKDVVDCAHVMNMISAYDEMDSTCMNVTRPDYTKFLVSDVRGLKIAMPKEYFNGAENAVKEKIADALKLLEAHGAVIKEISIPINEYALSAYYIISSAEASSNLARYDGVKYGYRTEKFEDITDMYFKTRGEGFGDEVKRRIMLGTYALSSGYYDAYYKKAQQVRGLIKQEFDKIFEEFDVIASPVYPTTAFKLGEKTGDPVKMYTGDLCTVSANIAGIPAISIPCGFDEKGLPVGLQLMAKAFGEPTLIKTAYTYQSLTDFHRKGAE